MINNDEIKKSRFIRIAEHRTNVTLGWIEKIGNMSNASNYSYTEDQIDKIFDALEDALAKAKMRLKNPSAYSFHLDSTDETKQDDDTQ